MQALSTAESDESYSPDFLRTVRERLAAMIDGFLPEANLV